MNADPRLSGLKFGPYRVIREIGRGATSAVYMAVDDGGGGGDDAFGSGGENGRPRQVAIKVVDFTDDRSKLSRRFRKLFATEAAVTAQFDHPNIAKVFDWKVEEKHAYLVMELVEGTGLDQFVTMDRLLPMHRAVGVIFKVAMALDYAHRRGIVHRDIKPANVMLTKDDEVKLMDFGLALNIRKNVNVDSTFINGLGSPSYMSPEQIKGYTLNHQTDLYSLGVMFYQLLTGRLPFRAPNTAALVYKIINTEAVPVTQLNPDLPEPINKVMQRALEKDLYSRYRLGADLAKDLSAIRFQILEENQVLPDETKWKAVRGLPLLGRLDDVDIWELLRLSAWRVLPPATVIMKDGDAGKSFGFIIDGEVEVEKGDRALAKLSRGDMVGEMAFLQSEGGTRTASVTTLNQVTFLEVNPAAFAFATEELSTEIRRLAVDAMVERMREVNRVARHYSPAAVHPAPLPEGEEATPAPAVAAPVFEAPGWSVLEKSARIAVPAFAMPEAEPVAVAPMAPEPVATPAPPARTTRSTTVVVQPLPPAAAAAIAQMALTQQHPAKGGPVPQPFELGPETTGETHPPLSVSDLPVDAILTTDLGARFDGTGDASTTELAGGFSARSSSVSTTEMAARLDPPPVATTEMAADYGRPPPADEGSPIAPDFDVHARTGRAPRHAEPEPDYMATTEMAAHFGVPGAPPRAVRPRAADPAPDYMATTEMAAHFGVPPASPMMPPSAGHQPLRASTLMPPVRQSGDQSTQELASHMMGSDDPTVELAGGFSVSDRDGLDGIGQDMFPPLTGVHQTFAPASSPPEEGYEATQLLDPSALSVPFPTLDLDTPSPPVRRPGTPQPQVPEDFDRTMEIAGGFGSEAEKAPEPPAGNMFPPLKL
jgi:serine/threonine protein kinase